MGKMKRITEEQIKNGVVPTCTRDGTKVVFFVDSGLDVDYPLVAWLEGISYPVSFKRDGKNSTFDSLDLMCETKPKTVMVALYKKYRDDTHIFSMVENSNKSFDEQVERWSRGGCLVKVETIEIEED